MKKQSNYVFSLSASTPNFLPCSTTIQDNIIFFSEIHPLKSLLLQNYTTEHPPAFTFSHEKEMHHFNQLALELAEKGHIAQALMVYEKCMEIVLKDTNSESNITAFIISNINSFIDISAILIERKDFPSALKLLSYINSKLLILNKSSEIQKVGVLNNIGCCYKHLNDMKLAIHYFDEALKLIYMNENLTEFFPTAYINIADIFHHKGMHKKALDMSKEALLYAQKGSINRFSNIKAFLTEAICYYNIAVEQEIMGDSSAAIGNYRLAVEKLYNKVDPKDNIYACFNDAVNRLEKKQCIELNKHFIDKGYNYNKQNKDLDRHFVAKGYNSNKKRIMIMTTSADLIETTTNNKTSRNTTKYTKTNQSMRVNTNTTNNEYLDTKETIQSNIEQLHQKGILVWSDEDEKAEVIGIMEKNSKNLLNKLKTLDMKTKNPIDENKTKKIVLEDKVLSSFKALNDNYIEEGSNNKSNIMQIEESLKYIENEDIIKEKEINPVSISSQIEKKPSLKSSLNLTKTLKNNTKSKDEIEESIVKGSYTSRTQKEKTILNGSKSERRLQFNENMQKYSVINNKKKNLINSPIYKIRPHFLINENVSTMKNQESQTSPILKKLTKIKKIESSHSDIRENIETQLKNLKSYNKGSDLHKIKKIQKYYRKRFIVKKQKAKQTALLYIASAITVQRAFRLYNLKKKYNFIKKRSKRPIISLGRVYRKLPESNTYSSIYIYLQKAELQLIFYVKGLISNQIENIINDDIEASYINNERELYSYISYRLAQLFSNKKKVIIAIEEHTDEEDEKNISENDIFMKEEEKKLALKRLSIPSRNMKIKERIRLLMNFQLKFLHRIQKVEKEIKSSQSIMKHSQFYTRTPLLKNLLNIILFHRVSEPHKLYMQGVLYINTERKKKRLNCLEIDKEVYETYNQQINKGNIWDIIVINEEKNILAFSEEVLYITQKRLKTSPSQSKEQTFLQLRNYFFGVLLIQKAIRYLLPRKQAEQFIKRNEDDKLELSRFHKMFGIRENIESYIFRIFLINPLEYLSEESDCKEGVIGIYLYNPKSHLIPVNMCKQKISEKLSIGELRVMIKYLKKSLMIEKDKFRPGIHISCEKFELLLLKHHNKLESYRNINIDKLLDRRNGSISEYITFKASNAFLENKFAFNKELTKSHLKNLIVESKKITEFPLTSSDSPWEKCINAQICISKIWKIYISKQKLKNLMHKIHLKRAESYQINVHDLQKLNDFLEADSKKACFSSLDENNPLNLSEMASMNSPSLNSERYFYRTLKMLNNRTYEICLAYNSIYKAINIDIENKKTKVKQKIVVPINIFGLYEMISVEDFQRNYVQTLVANLEIRDNKIYFNNNLKENQNLLDFNKNTYFSEFYGNIEKTRFSPSSIAHKSTKKAKTPASKKDTRKTSFYQKFLLDKSFYNKTFSEVMSASRAISNQSQLLVLSPDMALQRNSPFSTKTPKKVNKKAIYMPIKKLLMKDNNIGNIMLTAMLEGNNLLLDIEVSNNLVKELKKSFDLKTIIEKIDIKITKEPLYSLKKAFIMFYIINILKKSRISIEKNFISYEITENIENCINSWFSKYFCYFQAVMTIQKHFRRIIEKSKFDKMNVISEFSTFFKKVIHKRQYFLISFHIRRSTSKIAIKYKNLTSNSRSHCYWTCDLSYINPNLAKEAKARYRYRLSERFMSKLYPIGKQLYYKYLNIFNTNDTNDDENHINIVSLDENLILTSHNIEETHNRPSILPSPKKNIGLFMEKAKKNPKRSKFPTKLQKSAEKIINFLKTRQTRKKFKENRILKASCKVKKIFLRTIVLKKFENYILLHVFFQNKAILLLTFINVNSPVNNQTKYSLEIYPYSSELFSQLIRIPLNSLNSITINKLLNSFFLFFVSYLQVDLVFENVYAKIIHDRLKLKELNSFSKIEIEGSAFSRRIILMTRAIISLQHRFRKVKLIEKQLLLNESHRLRKPLEEKHGTMVKIKGIKINLNYYRVVVYKLYEDYRFIAFNICNRKEKYYTKFIRFDKDLIYTSGRLLLDYLIECLDIDEIEGLKINYKSKYNILKLDGNNLSHTLYYKSVMSSNERILKKVEKSQKSVKFIEDSNVIAKFDEIDEIDRKNKKAVSFEKICHDKPQDSPIAEENQQDSPNELKTNQQESNSEIADQNEQDLLILSVNDTKMTKQDSPIGDGKEQQSINYAEEEDLPIDSCSLIPLKNNEKSVISKNYQKKPTFIRHFEAKYNEPKLIYHNTNSNTNFDVYYNKNSNEDSRRILEEKQKNSIQINVNLQNLTSYNRNFKLDNTFALNSLASELSHSILIDKKRIIMIDSNKINPSCIELIEDLKPIYEGKSEIEKRKTTFLDFHNTISNKDCKTILFKTLKVFNNVRYHIIGSLIEKKLNKIKTSLINEEIDVFDDFEVMFEIVAKNQTTYGFTSISISLGEANLLMKVETASRRNSISNKDIVINIINNLRVCEEYFIYTLKEYVTKHELKRILEIAKQNKLEKRNLIIFIRKSTIDMIHNKFIRFKVKKNFKEYLKKSKSFKRIYYKSIYEINKSHYILILSLYETSKLAVFIWKVLDWSFIGKHILNYERYKYHLINPLKWRSFLDRLSECLRLTYIYVNEGQVVIELEDDILMKKLLNDINMQKIQDVEDNLYKTLN